MKTWWKPYSSPPLCEASGRGAAGGRQAESGPKGAADSVAQARPAAGAGPVDAHVHIFPPEIIREREAYLGRDAWFGTLYGSPEARMVGADEVVAHMDATGVEVSVVFGFAFGDQGLCRMVNDYVIEAVGRHPGRLAGLACVSPGAPGAVAELERCLDAGLRGCGELMPDGQGFGGSPVAASGAGGDPGGGAGGTARARGGSSAPAPDGFAAIARCLEERDLPLLIHANEPVGHHYPGKGRFTPEACFALAEAHPALTIVFAHMGGGLFLYELMPEVRRALARVYYDTSAVPYLYGPDVYAVAVLCAGEGKLIFGSDYPLLSPGRYLEGFGGLAPGARAATLGNTARKVFKL
jgi:predicted TIM-barrel fold metal-dependent hydrolase